jgi:hypothetical protein
MQQRPISFPDWKQVLADSPLSPSIKAAYLREILAFLRYCKSSRAAATVEVAREFLEWREQVANGPARDALRWFYRQGSRSKGSLPGSGAATDDEHRGASPIHSVPEMVSFVKPGIARAMEPPPAASDLGSQPWERDLIKAVRERGFLWRTEQTYREWAVRFARFIAPRSPYAGTAEDGVPKRGHAENIWLSVRCWGRWLGVPDDNELHCC